MTVRSAAVAATAALRVKHRSDLAPSRPRRAVILLASVLLGGAIGAVMLQIMHVNPWAAYQALISGAFGSSDGIVATLLKTSPLLLAGLGVLVSFRAGIYNIGNQGQFLAGALASTWVALHIGSPSPLVGIPLVILSGAAGGALWVLVPAVMRAFWGINEIITTLMFNYIALYLVDYLVNGPMQDQSLGVPETAFYPSGTQLPIVASAQGTQLHAGFIIALVAMVCVGILVARTFPGYEIRAIGFNPRAAQYAGISIRTTIIGVMLLSGALSGLAGMGEVAGVSHQLLDGIDGGFEYTPIVVALLGGLSPLGCGIAALGFAGLNVGGDNMQTVVGLPSSFISIIEALIVLFVLAGEYLGRFTITRISRETAQTQEADG